MTQPIVNGHTFADKYIIPLINSKDEAARKKGLKLANDFNAAMIHERQAAFEIGYRTALDLILEEEVNSYDR